MQYFTETKLFKIVSWIGKYTLEIYVVHIALRDVFLNVFGVLLTREREILLILILYIIISILLGVLLQRILEKIRIS